MMKAARNSFIVDIMEDEQQARDAEIREVKKTAMTSSAAHLKSDYRDYRDPWVHILTNNIAFFSSKW